VHFILMYIKFSNIFFVILHLCFTADMNLLLTKLISITDITCSVKQVKYMHALFVVKLLLKHFVFMFQSNMTRDSLAKALYCRTVATIVRRANSLKRLGSTLGTLSSDSNESVHNQAEVSRSFL
jgi:hypothetical protein